MAFFVVGTKLGGVSSALNKKLPAKFAGAKGASNGDNEVSGRVTVS